MTQLFHLQHCQTQRGGNNCDCGAANGVPHDVVDVKPARFNEASRSDVNPIKRKKGGQAKKVGEPNILCMLFVLQDGCCFHCGQKLTRPLTRDGDPLSWNEDHLTPKVIGGGRANNIVISCYKCNTEKSGRKPTDEEIARAQILHARAIALGVAYYGRNPWPTWGTVYEDR